MWMVNTSVLAGAQTGMSLLLAVNTVLNVLLSGSVRLLIFFFFFGTVELGHNTSGPLDHRFGYTRAPDPYFEIWVWKASILVRVLVSSSNTFSWRRTEQSQGGNSRWRDSLQPVGLLPPPTCTATPKLFPSSIFGTCSCSHMDTCNMNTHLKLIWSGGYIAYNWYLVSSCLRKNIINEFQY